jgi:AraC family transcriptional regulator
MTRTANAPKPPRPLTPDDRPGHIPFAFQHTSATLGWHGLQVEHDPQQPASDLVHPPRRESGLLEPIRL